MICAGLDLGSRNSKLVLYESSQNRVVYSQCIATGTKVQDTIQSILDNAYSHFPKIERIAATGYGRHLCHFAEKKLSEVTCHAEGVKFFFPNCRSIIDIGGQDSKLLTLEDKVTDFIMNDKCAAGTGRFLEMTALKLGIPLEDMSKIAEAADKVIELSSTCVVFAESEIIGLLAENTTVANILRAVHNSIAKRILSQAAQLCFQSPTVFTGGVAQNDDLHHCLEKCFGVSILRPPDPEITGALGAALIISR